MMGLKPKWKLMSDLTDNERLRLAQLDEFVNTMRLLNHNKTYILPKLVVDALAKLDAPPSNLVAVDRDNLESMYAISKARFAENGELKLRLDTLLKLDNNKD